MDPSVTHSGFPGNNVSGTPKKVLLNIIRDCVNVQPEKIALTFLDHLARDQACSLNYAELHLQAASLAAEFKDRALVGKRVLILIPSCIEYVTTFLACLYAGVIAIPAYPPRNNYHAQRIAIIARDADVTASLVMSDKRDSITSYLGQALNSVPNVIAVDELALRKIGWVNEAVRAEDLAYLQYTSGSTGDPKGVMVRHGDLVANSALYSVAAGLKRGETFVSWLPVFHDMGLVQGIVMPLTLGGQAVFMAPVTFVSKPLLWLKAIDRYRAAFSGAPNFAYQLCVDKVSQEAAARLDLSHWRVALNAAEPISCQTTEAFIQKFATSGFRRETMVGGFGLAEATLYVTCGKGDQYRAPLSIARKALEQDRVELMNEAVAGAMLIHSSGSVCDDPQVVIVEPAQYVSCPDKAVGEIWVSGSSVCGGYWNQPEESLATFSATLESHPGVAFMRTGDLGFIHENELYVTGRLKDLIIVRGANHYPQDLEETAQQVHQDLYPSGAAFSVEKDGRPQLVLAQEVKRNARHNFDFETVGRAIEQRISEAHGVLIDAVVFLPPHGVPKTSSGKTQRKACRAMYLEGTLKQIGGWVRPAITKNSKHGVSTDLLNKRPLLMKWLSELVASLGGLDVQHIYPDQALSAFGLDSVKLVELVAELSAALSMDISATIPFEYPTVNLLADYLTGCASDVSHAESEQEPIAIVGLACRFPGAENVDAFWQLLNGDQDAISEVSSARIALTNFRAGNQDAYRWGGFIDDVECFDATLFGISPREARSVDPQQRLLLQTAWHALEYAQIAPDSLSGSNTGVFVGISNNDYFRLQGDLGMAWDAYAGTGSALSVAANRLSYLLGLQGPSMAIDTACSSSLVAVHQACRSLAYRESHLALVGGVNLVLSADYGEIFSQANMLSPSGRCHTFDENADGYVRGEGCGFVVLKRLSDALKDGSQVLAVIKGSAVNQDGRSNGLSAPNGLAQQRVICAALASAGISGAEVDYVETHGTGTPLGDPIEVNALKAVLDTGDGTPSKPCWLGAVKSKIGHLESAAGIAGLIKTALILQHKQIPANQYFNALNPHIDLDASRLLPVTKGVSLPTATDKPLIASVSSFGFGGTNAHMVLQSHHGTIRDLPNVPDNTAPGAALLTLSAASEVSLRELAGRYAVSLVEPMDPLTFNNEFCIGANTSRAALNYRVAVVGTQEEISRGLLSIAKGEAIELDNVTRGSVNQPLRVALLFTGQGSQYANMGSELYQHYEVYRTCIDHCDALLQPYLDCSLKSVLYGDNSALIDETRYAQPALVATEIALFELWKHWGVEPEFVLGHSVGEYSAAYAAGVMGLATVLKLVAERGRLMSESHGNGAMLSVPVSLDAAKAHLGNTLLDLDIAAINTPEQVVLSGAKKCVLRAKNIFEAAGVDVTLLKVSHGFHSRLMAPVQAHFASAFEGLELKAPVVTMITTGGQIDGIVSDTQYWVAQLCQPVRFSDAFNRLLEEGADTFVEMGPAPILTALGRSMSAKGHYLPSLRARVDDTRQMKGSLGALYTIGATTFTKNSAEHPTCSSPALPLYPFEKQRFWFEKLLYNTANGGVISASAEPCGDPLDIAFDEFESFATQLPGASGAFLLEHRLQMESVLPAAAYLELMASAIRKSAWLAEAQSTCIHDIHFISPLNLSDEPVMVQTLLIKQEGAGGIKIQVRAKSLADAGWVTCASARFIESATVESPLPPAADLSMAQAIDMTEFYAAWHERGLAYGPAFQALTDLRCANGEVQGKVSLTVDAGIWGKHGVHPTLLDGAFQALGALLYGRDAVDHRVPLPTAIESLQFFATTSTVLNVRAKIREEASSSASVVADIELYDKLGVPVVQVVGLSLTWLDAYALVQPSHHDQAQRFQIEWREEEVHAETGGACAAEWLVFHHQQDASVTSFAEASNNAIVPIALESWAHASQKQLLSALAKAKAISRVVVLINHELLDATTTVDSISKGLALCQFMQRLMLALESVATLDADFQLCLLTRQAESVNAAESRAVAQSGVAGMLRSAALEYPHFSVCQCDIPVTLNRTEWGLVYTQLNHSLSNALVLREGRLFTPVLMPVEQPVDGGAPFTVREKGSYLITGGTGGLGLAVAEWLVDAGARQLVLVGRRGMLDSEGNAQISRLRQRGVEVEIRRADLGCPDEVQTLFARLAARHFPLRGIVHGAGLVDDQPLANIAPDSWQRVVEAKALSAHLLDQSSRSLLLDFFVAFSSISSVLGSAGQCNYAAANAMLDALMAERRSRGESGICINWGPWGQVGMASGADLSARLKQQGIRAMAPANALANLGEVLTRGDGQTVVADIDWQQFSERLPLSEPPALLRGLMKSVATAASSPNSAVALSLPLPEALVLLPEDEALKEILLGLGSLISQVLHIRDDAVLQNHERVSALQLSQLGIDSLMAMELRNRIRAWTHVELPAHLLIGNNRMSAAAELIHQKMLVRCLSVQSEEHDATTDEDTEVFVL